ALSAGRPLRIAVEAATEGCSVVAPRRPERASTASFLEPLRLRSFACPAKILRLETHRAVPAAPSAATAPRTGRRRAAAAPRPPPASRTGATRARRAPARDGLGRAPRGAGRAPGSPKGVAARRRGSG